jgi:hypothetical protein
MQPHSRGNALWDSSDGMRRRQNEHRLMLNRRDADGIIGGSVMARPLCAKGVHEYIWPNQLLQHQKVLIQAVLKG